MWIGIGFIAAAFIIGGWILTRITRRERNVDDDG
jgi:hypothetical protein